MMGEALGSAVAARNPSLCHGKVRVGIFRLAFAGPGAVSASRHGASPVAVRESISLQFGFIMSLVLVYVLFGGGLRPSRMY